MAKFVSLDRLSKFLEQVKTLIPTVNNPTITIKQAGSDKGSFTLNQSGATTIELTDTNTTYSAATTSKAGLMSAADKTKLDGMSDDSLAIYSTSELWWNSFTSGVRFFFYGGADVDTFSIPTRNCSVLVMRAPNGYGTALAIQRSGSTAADPTNMWINRLPANASDNQWMGWTQIANTNTGTASTSGTTKLYTTTGTATDGTLTQAAITDLIGDVETLLAAI